jgi:phosphoglycerate dehydrogenase-like enzyme
MERYSDVRFNDDGLSLSGESLVEFARGRQKIITALERIDEAFLAAVPEIRVISKYGVGTDTLDLAAMARNGVHLGWTEGVNKRSVAELAIAFMICLLHEVPQANRELIGTTWRNRQGRELSGRVVGIVGCGNVGKDLTVLLRAFGCRVLAYDILDFPEFYSAHRVEPVRLEELLSDSDITTLHVPLSESTRNMFDAETLALMKTGSILINTARGGIVDEEAVKAMLIDGRLAGAAFDVFAVEPPTDLDFLRLPNFLCTPHIGGSSEEAVLAMGRAAIKGLDHNQLAIAI